LAKFCIFLGMNLGKSLERGDLMGIFFLFIEGLCLFLELNGILREEYVVRIMRLTVFFRSNWTITKASTFFDVFFQRFGFWAFIFWEFFLRDLLNRFVDQLAGEFGAKIFNKTIREGRILLSDLRTITNLSFFRFFLSFFFLAWFFLRLTLLRLLLTDEGFLVLINDHPFELGANLQPQLTRAG
jgi:hypothetical protein